MCHRPISIKKLHGHTRSVTHSPIQTLRHLPETHPHETYHNQIIIGGVFKCLMVQTLDIANTRQCTTTRHTGGPIGRNNSQ